MGTLSLTLGGKEYTMDKRQSLPQLMLENWIATCKKNETRTPPNTVQKIKLKIN